MDLAPEALILRGDQQDHSMPEFAWTADLNGVWQEQQCCPVFSMVMEAVEAAVCVELVGSMRWAQGSPLDLDLELTAPLVSAFEAPPPEDLSPHPSQWKECPKPCESMVPRNTLTERMNSHPC